MTIHLDETTMIVLGIAAASLLYLFMTVLVARACYRSELETWKDWVERGNRLETYGSIFVGLIWPVSGPIMALSFLIKWHNGGKA